MGCDYFLQQNLTQSVSFNPRTRMGCDCFSQPNLTPSAVSIHAPAWGATRTVNFRSFNTWFQSTHPHGVRPASHKSTSNHHRFNPRTRMGCDPCIKARARLSRVSIHAPAWGATYLCNVIKKKKYRFNPRTRMGCDLTGLCDSVITRFVSIHAPAWGATAPCHCMFPSVNGFQSTHPHGVRL